MAFKIKLDTKRQYNYPKSIKEVDELTGEQFELFIFEYLKQYQDYDGKLTEKNDYGVDILLWRKEEPSNRFGVQCKRYGPKTILGENDLMKMQKGVTHYGLFNSQTKKPNLILFTSAEKNQITNRGLEYIVNEEINGYYREDIISIIKDIDEKLNRDINKSNYSNIAFETSKMKKGSFREDTKFVDMLKRERMNISKYNKITPVYLVYNDKDIKDIVYKKPISLDALLEVKGFDKKKINLFGEYLVNRIRAFMKLDSLKSKEETKKIVQEELTIFLKGARKKIASYNKIDKLYNVFNNKTLDEIVEKKPMTKDELIKINGIGPGKVSLWGAILLMKSSSFLKSKQGIIF